MEVAHNAALKIEAATILNAPFDGFSCESSWQRTLLINYLKGVINCLGIIDSNYTLNNLHYHLIGGSCSAVIRTHVIDPWLLKMVGAPWDLTRVVDFASNLVILIF